LNYPIAGLLLALSYLLVPLSAFGSEAELRDAYSAYQEAVEIDDLHAALPHAERAYELAIEGFSTEGLDVGHIARNLGRLQFDLAMFDEASETLRTAYEFFVQSGSASPAEVRRAAIDLTKAFLAARRIGDAQMTLEGMQAGRHENYASGAMEAAEIDYLTGLLVLLEHPHGEIEQHVDYLSYILGSGDSSDYSNFEDHEARAVSIRVARSYLRSAREQFVQHNDQVAIASIDLALAALMMEEDGHNAASKGFVEAVDRLIELEYADYFVVSLASSWVTRFTRRNSRTRDRNAHIDRVRELSNLRTEGDVVHLVRVRPQFPSGAANAQVTGSICMQYSVDAEGITDNIRRCDEPMDNCDVNPRWFAFVSRAAVRDAIFAPKMIRGTPTMREDLTYCFRFNTGDASDIPQVVPSLNYAPILPAPVN